MTQLFIFLCMEDIYLFDAIITNDREYFYMIDDDLSMFELVYYIKDNIFYPTRKKVLDIIKEMIVNNWIIFEDEYKDKKKLFIALEKIENITYVLCKR